MSKGSVAKARAEGIVGGAVDALMRAVSAEATKRVAERTPVASGRARANWNGSVDQPDVSVNEEATLAEAASKLAQNTATALGVGFAGGQTYVLSNGLPYIEKLENGHSKQAPAGMVELTLGEMRQFVEAEAGKVASRGE